MKKTASISALIVAFSAIAGLAVMSTACGDDDTTNGGTTSSGGTSGATSGGTSGATSGGTSGATSGGTSGSTSGDALALAKANCARTKACQPNFYAANYADDAACASAGSSGTTTTYPGLESIAAADCAAKVTANTDSSQNSTVILGCTKAGTLADATACNFAGQCANGLCSKAAATDNCGKCGAAKKDGETCDPAKNECVTGDYCATDKCKAFGKAGDACDATDATKALCGLGLACKDKKCTAPPRSATRAPRRPWPRTATPA